MESISGGRRAGIRVARNPAVYAQRATAGAGRVHARVGGTHAAAIVSRATGPSTEETGNKAGLEMIDNGQYA